MTKPDGWPTALQTLAEFDQWVAWRDEAGRKVPIDPHTGSYASTTDSMTWGSLARAHRAYESVDGAGVGFVLADSDPFVGIDLDDCLAAGTLDERASAIVDWIDSYTEVSPSGAGVKLWCRDPQGVIGRAYKRPGVEVYPSRRYFTVTADRWLGTPLTIEPAAEGLRWLLSTHLSRDETLSDSDLRVDGADPESFPVDPDEWVVEALEAIDPDCPYDQWIGVGMALHHGLGGGAFDLWDAWSSRGAKYEPGEMEAKWQSFAGAPGERRKSLKYVWWLAEQYGWQWTPASPTWLDEAGPIEPKPYRPETQRGDLEAPELDADKPPVGTGDRERGDEVSESPLQLYDFAETYRDDSPYEDDLVAPGVLGGGDLGMLFGPPKSMKTFAAMAMSRQWAMGREWMDMRAERRLRVLYLNFELKQDRWRQRSHMVDLSDDELDALKGQFWYTERFLATLTREFLEQCVDSVHQQVGKPIDLLVVDPLANFYPGESESDNQEVSQFIRQLRRLARSLGEECATLLVHHASKSEYEASFSNIRGASAFRGAYDTGLYLYPEEDSERLTMEREARNAEGLGSLQLTFDGDSGRFERVDGAVDGPESERKAGEVMGQRWDAEHRRKATTVLDILRHEAREGRVYTKSDFGQTWGSNSRIELGSSRSVTRLVDELLTKQLVAYFDAGEYGGPSKHGNSAGHLCCRGMVLPPTDSETIDEAQGACQEVEPVWFKRPGHPEPVHRDRLDDPTFADPSDFFVEHTESAE